MPSIKVPTKYVKKLKELGVYDQWLFEFKRYCEDNIPFIRCKERNFKMSSTFQKFISSSFLWGSSLHGSDFWEEISKK